MNGNLMYRNALPVISVIMAVFMTAAAGCSREPAWKALNEKIIKEKNIRITTRDDMLDTGVNPSLAPGQVINKKNLPDVEIAPGVTGKMYWGKGVLINWMTMAPGSEIPVEQLACDRIMVVWKGSVEQYVDGEYKPMKQYDTVTNWTSTPHKDALYLQAFDENGVRAGNEGSELLEIYWPVRLDYVKKAGGKIPVEVVTKDYHIDPSITPHEIIDFYDIQFTNLSEMTANSRIIACRGALASFLSTDPGRVSPFHCHPEEQLTIILRNQVKETIMDKEVNMQEGDILYLPSNMIHRGEYDSKGCDMLDVFWPPRPDYIDKMYARLAKYHAIIPEGEKPVLVHDGEKDEPLLNFTEGPSWMGGRLFFSNMWFAKDWSAGSPEKSNTIRMDKDGKFKIISKNMQTNGTMPLGNGNLAVCDMFGHRLIEMTPEGKVVRTLADKYNGVPFDGPNDLVIDANGGIYITDPQFTPGLPKTQPGKAVYYRKKSGEVIRVIEPGAFGQPNGILLSPDGRTCYINNTRNMPVGNYVMAYDVNGDGTLTNGRKFAKVFIPPNVLQNEDVATGADGMTIDVLGNIYVATTMGIQIFDKNGEFTGIVNLPIRPVSCVFGGEDMQTIFCTCATRIYSIRTKVKGLEYPLKK
jgi:gluconolactonase